MSDGKGGPEFPLRWLGWVWLVSAISSLVLTPARMLISRSLIASDSASTEQISQTFEAMALASMGISLLVYGFAIAGTAILIAHVKHAPRGAAPASKVALVGLILGLLLMGANYLPIYGEDMDFAMQIQLVLGNSLMLAMIAVWASTAWAALVPLREFGGREAGMICLGIVMALQVLAALIATFLFRELQALMWLEFGLSITSRFILGGLLLAAASHVLELRARFQN